MGRVCRRERGHLGEQPASLYHSHLRGMLHRKHQGVASAETRTDRRTAAGRPGTVFLGKPGAEATGRFAERSQEQGQMLKAAHQACSSRLAVQEQLRESTRQRGPPSSQMGLIPRTETPHLAGGCRQLAMLGHAFTHHCLFPSPVVSLGMFNAVRFLVIFKDS